MKPFLALTLHFVSNILLKKGPCSISFTGIVANLDKKNKNQLPSGCDVVLDNIDTDSVLSGTLLQGVLNIALSRFIKQGKKRELIHLLKWMKNQRYELASSTLNSVLKKLQESGQSDVAEMLSREFTSSSKQVMPL
jgi:hypothetical protein